MRPSILRDFLGTIYEPIGLGRAVLRKSMVGAKSIGMEEAMRLTILAATATFVILAAGCLAPNRADAMTVSMPAGITKAIDGTNLAQDIAYVCRRVWRCGPWGCGWRRVCWWTGPRYHRHYYRYW
jgi:hypothetical protein